MYYAAKISRRGRDQAGKSDACALNIFSTQTLGGGIPFLKIAFTLIRYANTPILNNSLWHAVENGVENEFPSVCRYETSIITVGYNTHFHSGWWLLNNITLTGRVLTVLVVVATREKRRNENRDWRTRGPRALDDRSERDVNGSSFLFYRLFPLAISRIENANLPTYGRRAS